MNIIIANKQSEKLNNLNIEVMKRLDGEFEAEDIIQNFHNLFYNKMILDITALKNPDDINNLQKLSISLDMSKIILLLEEGSTLTLPANLSKIISIGIYNFTTTVEGIMYLYNNPNTYRDVAQYHKIEPQVQPVEPIIAQAPIINEVNVVENPTIRKTILGIKNVTKGAGATTLTYMLKKELERNYDVVAIEIDKKDFTYFNDKNLVSTSASQLSDVLSNNISRQIILLDLGDNENLYNACTQVIYLIEPSTIRLNRLLLGRPNVLKELKGKKVVLNMCALNSKDIKDFEYEANIDVFATLPVLDERKQNQEIINLLSKLGINN